MARPFFCLLAVGCTLASAGCSDPMPASAAVGLRLNLVSEMTCPLMGDVPSPNIGNPPPDSVAGTPGKRVYSGEGKLKASCSVRDNGGGNFGVTGNISGTTGFSVDGTIMGPSGQAKIAIAATALPDPVQSPTGESCSLTPVTSTRGLEVRPGEIWAQFFCSRLTAPPNYDCTVSGEFIFENCSK